MTHDTNHQHKKHWSASSTMKGYSRACFITPTETERFRGRTNVQRTNEQPSREATSYLRLLRRWQEHTMLFLAHFRVPVVSLLRHQWVIARRAFRLLALVLLFIDWDAWTFNMIELPVSVICVVFPNVYVLCIIIACSSYVGTIHSIYQSWLLWVS